MKGSVVDCRSCGKQNPEDSEFCGFCGAGLKDTQDISSSRTKGILRGTRQPETHRRLVWPIWLSAAFLLLLVMVPLILICYDRQAVTSRQEQYYSLAGEVEDIRTEAASLCEKNDKKDAAKRLLAALALESDVNRAHKEAFGTAGPAYISADFESILYDLSCCYLDMGQLKKAISTIDKAITKMEKRTGETPKQEADKLTLAKYYRFLSDLYIRSGSPDQAISVNDKAIKLSPNDCESHVLMGLAYEAKGDFLKASDYYNKALGINPCYERALFLLRRLNPVFLNRSQDPRKG